MAFNENTRVKIPAILHLCRLGYTYLSLANVQKDNATNIFTGIFHKSLLRINPDITSSDIKRTFEKISLALDNEDLGQQFYEMLLDTSEVKIIDFKNFNNNFFHVVTELTYRNGDDEFRPDITILVNGMPLVFIEVKKPNNHEGIIAERNRIDARFKNKKFRKFINISQLLVFSNNMEYDHDSIEPIQGAFYSGTSYELACFNSFREEEKFDFSKILLPEDDNIENFVLKDNNLTSIKYSPEFSTNKDINTPTNRILTSLFCKERIAFLLKYSIAYVRTEEKLEKHVMRYPQIFATKAIESNIDNGITKGIIWHTQGSGKTALSYYNVNYLIDYFQWKNIIPKFYFIVDRIDLLIQAKSEFTSRGLIVHTVNSKEELLKDFGLQQAFHNLSGKREITVVNIQKFENDTDILKAKDYSINIQRIYFLDEVHRSYNPTGSFLANLFNSDRNAILIGLTGTPLILKDRRSRDVFGDYIHKYYYNSSIADGYTLKLIREGIETKYKILLEEALKRVEILKGDADKKVIYAHERFVEPMLEYIVTDFIKSRIRFGDHSIGAMVVCDSSDQAKNLFEIFNQKYSSGTDSDILDYSIAAEAHAEYKNYTNHLTSALILHDIGSKEDRKDEIENFKAGKIDILFVFNMLLTGFDAKRLKKLYLARIVRDHNLLQTLTRVNRPYKDFRYGYVVDFADIRKEFDATNKAYFEELQSEYGDEIKTYSNLFKLHEEIEQEIKDIKETLFQYSIENAELFSQQISQIEDRKKVLELKKALENAKNLYNIILFTGQLELLERLDFKKLQLLYNEANHHLDLLNLKESIENKVDTTNLLNVALENILFMFQKVSEDELIISDQLRDSFRKAREALLYNFDKNDPQFVTLFDELRRMMDKKNIAEVSQEQMKANIDTINKIYDKIKELNRLNDLLRAKYENDEKYARIHKRLMEKGLSKSRVELQETLSEVKKQVDEQVLQNNRMMNNEGYFEQLLMQMVVKSFMKSSIKLEPDSAEFINNLIVKEYLNEFQGIRKW